MFEKFVNGKIDSENEIVNNLADITKESILKSNLSDFTKNFLINDYDSFKSTDELKDIISKSNKLYFNFTIRPKWTLLTFLFNNFESRPPKDVLNKLNYFPFYKFYSDSVKGYIEENVPIFVTRYEIQNIIDETNKAILEKLTNEISNLKIKNFFLQIFLLKYEAESRINLESEIPYSFIKIFLEDKSYFELEKKFSKIRTVPEESLINLKDIIKILTDKFNYIEKETSEIVIAPPSLPAESVKKNIDKDKIVITNKELEKKTSETSQKLSKSEVKNSSNKIIQEGIQDESASGIRRLFDENQTEKIINKIYQADLIKKKKSFDKLELYSNWKDASKHLKEVFKINNVDIYNKDVISFVNVLNEYFKRLE
ncbi:MAG TPA: hypothetical protein PKD83_04795 [Ignavibacteria bacterium]|nr:hypothetical protein [Ignavibacteria bacterium]